MTVLATNSSSLFEGSGNNGPFTWTWRFLDNDHIRVVKIVNDVEIVLVEGVDYAIAGAGSYAGGSVITTADLEAGEELFVERNTDLLQDLDLRNQGDFFPETYEDALDKKAMVMQDRQRSLDRSIKMPLSVTGDFTIPSGSRSDTYLGFDSNGDLVLRSFTVPVSTVVYVDATAGPVNVALPESGEVVIIKTDSTVNEVNVVPTEGKTVMRQASLVLGVGALEVQDEIIRLVMNGSNWYKI
jgi:hypothetical protein